jgi:hypothetical protein
VAQDSGVIAPCLHRQKVEHLLTIAEHLLEERALRGLPPLPLLW